ncbi:MAG TPA: hypothetical protein VKZ44_09295 [Taishania sp.]|nr:hypothetical protein [Taishania sp.]
MISSRLKGLYKSWINTTDLDSLKNSGKLLHLAKFYHPLITVDFVRHLGELKKEMEKYSNLIFIGGWSEGLETQNSAIISAQKALENYKIFKGE